MEPPSSSSPPPSVHPEALLAGASYSHFSPIPPALLRPADTADPASRPPPCVLGIDEAGRGPVLGPMVYALFLLPAALSDPLLRHGHGFDDSKALTPARRRSLFLSLCDPASDLHRSCAWATTLLSARDIAAGMLRPPASSYNLNAQAFDATVHLIRSILARGLNLEHIYVDTVGPPATYQDRLQRLFPSVAVTVAKKADSLYPCVSAASVCAKVTRDAALDELYRARSALPSLSASAPTSVDDSALDPEANAPPVEAEAEAAAVWGSGYPSDPRCVAWMKSSLHPVFGWGPECRFSWAPARDLLDTAAVRVDWPDPETDPSAAATPLPADYFSSSTSSHHPSNELATWFGSPVGLESSF